nr:unnamed protein product [Callosobruchus chinensis]
MLTYLGSCCPFCLVYLYLMQF